MAQSATAMKTGYLTRATQGRVRFMASDVWLYTSECTERARHAHGERERERGERESTCAHLFTQKLRIGVICYLDDTPILTEGTGTWLERPIGRVIRES